MTEKEKIFMGIIRSCAINYYFYHGEKISENELVEILNNNSLALEDGSLLSIRVYLENIYKQIDDFRNYIEETTKDILKFVVVEQ